MTHEEFAFFSKIEVSARFYSEVIEPAYMAQEAHKQEFVAWWLKDNESSIVKAHTADISRASEAQIYAACINADFEKLMAEKAKLRKAAENWETKFNAARGMAESWKADYYELKRQIDQVDPLKAHIFELEAKVIRLKAQLFDLMDSEG